MNTDQLVCWGSGKELFKPCESNSPQKLECWLWKYFALVALGAHVNMLYMYDASILTEHYVWICREITHLIFFPLFHFLMATFLEFQSHWLNSCSTYSLSLSLSLPLLPLLSPSLSPSVRLWWPLDSELHCISDMFIDEIGTGSRAAIEQANR